MSLIIGFRGLAETRYVEALLVAALPTKSVPVRATWRWNAAKAEALEYKRRRRELRMPRPWPSCRRSGLKSHPNKKHLPTDPADRTML